MPSVSFDARSFAIDSRRVWLVSGTVRYTQTSNSHWRHRLQAAKQAGLNCIEVPVAWSAHERQPGAFDFDGDLDIRRFVQTAAEEGLYCILRPGPYIGSEYDFGGLPAYLHGVTDKKGNRLRFREDEPLFLEAVDRYLRALMGQVDDLQVACTGSPGSASHRYPPGGAAGGYQGEGGGPIILMQVEHAWESQAPEQAYLTRLVSMLRQHGCEVPLTNANNLWQPVDGVIDTWRGSDSLPAMMRQLAAVQPEAPAMVSHFTTHDGCPDPDTLAYRLAGLIGVGAQFNLSPFDTGSYSNLLSKHTGGTRAGFLAEAGHRGSGYRTVKRLATFASQFGSILASSEPVAMPSVALNEADHPTALLHQRSGQGELIMLVKSEGDKTTHTELMLGNGLTLDVPHAGQRAAWVLLDAGLGGRSTLDYTSLSPWALLDRRLLVVFGPAGSTGQLSIDGQHHSVTVPPGKTPLVIEGDPVCVAVLNHEQIDAAYHSGQGLVIGCDGLDEDDQPVPLKGWGTQITISLDGKATRKRIKQPGTAAAPRLTDWRTLTQRTLIDGTDPGYQSLAGPASLGTLGQAFGYGWYRIQSDKPLTGKVLPYQSGDRLHVYSRGRLAALLGKHEGADNGPKQLKLTNNTVVLADALWRASDGQAVGTDPKGLADHLYTVKPIKTGNPVVSKQPAGDPFSVVGYAHHQRAGARPMSQALTWTIKPESRKPVFLEIDNLPQACVVSVNGEPLYYYPAEADAGPMRLLLDPAQLESMTGGKNTITLELLEPLSDGVKIGQHVRFYQTTGSTADAGWAFAPWTIPTSEDSSWRDLPKSLPSQPTWLSNTFTLESLDAPLSLELNGMSKGLAVLNGHHIGRYWQQTREGKAVQPQQRHALPKPWLKLNEPNVIMLFDEHGRTPDKCRLVCTDR